MSQTYQARRVAEGKNIDHTPVSAVGAGDVVILGAVVGVPPNDIAANVKGSLDVEGRFDVVKVNGVISQGARIYWDANGDPQGGTAGTGAVTTSAGGNTFMGLAEVAAGATDETVRVLVRYPDATTVTIHESTSAVIADPGDAGAIPVTNSGNLMIVSAGAETRTLAAPTFTGQMLLIAFKTDGGDVTITVATTIDEEGSTTITFSNTGESCMLVAVEEDANKRWRLVYRNGCIAGRMNLDGPIADPGDAGSVPVTRNGHCMIVTGGAETRTLAAPSFTGQLLLLSMKTDGGDCVVTAATGLDEEGSTTITFANAGESILLAAVEEGANKRWRTVYANGCVAGRMPLHAVIADPGDAGAVPVTQNGNVSLVTGGAETRTLAAPTFVGQRLSLGFKTDGGDCVVTCATGVNQTGNNTLTFADAGDVITLQAIEVGGNLRWRVGTNDGVALSTV